MDRTTFARHLAENPIGGESDIAGWTEISDGWESVMFVVTLGSGDRWVVRSFAPERGDTARREFLGLGLLSEAGYPVPDVLRLVLEEAPFMLMEFIDGREMWLVIADTADRFDLVDTFVGLHRELHALDPTPFAALDEGAFEAPLEYELGTWERIRGAYPIEGFDPLFDWLMTRLPSIEREPAVVCHRDLHPGNVLMTPNGPIVIDWTQVGLGDPRLDIAWTQMVVGFGDEGLGDALVNAYGVEGDPWFQVAAGVKRLFSVAVSLQHGAESLGMREGTEERMLGALGGLRIIRDRVRDLTGISVAVVDRALDQ